MNDFIFFFLFLEFLFIGNSAIQKKTEYNIFYLYLFRDKFSVQNSRSSSKHKTIDDKTYTNLP